MPLRCLTRAGVLYFSEKLKKKAVAVSEEKIQEHSRRRGRFSSSHFSLPENAQTLAGIAFRVAGKSVKNSQQRTATAFSSFLNFGLFLGAPRETRQLKL